MTTEQKTTEPKANFRLFDRTGGGVNEDIYAESMEAAIEAGREWIEAGEWGDYQGPLECEVGPIIYDEDGEVDEDSTYDADREDCSGEIAAEDPECEEDEDGEHDWQAPYEVVGGLKENPGVWGSQHGKVKCTEVCAHCGRYRHTNDGATDDSGNAKTVVTFRDPDESSLEWIASLT